jgi:hypothetical protein
MEKATRDEESSLADLQVTRHKKRSPETPAEILGKRSLLYLPYCGTDDDESSFSGNDKSSLEDSDEVEHRGPDLSAKTSTRKRERNRSTVTVKNRSTRFPKPGDSDPSEWPSRPIPVRRSTPLRTAAAEAKKIKWTECIAAAHIVQDEARIHLDESVASMIDPLMLAEWTGRVSKTLVLQNTQVLDNLEAITAAKVGRIRVTSLQDDIAKSKTHVRVSKKEHIVLGEKLEMQRQFNSEVRVASRFLKHIEKLSK